MYAVEQRSAALEKSNDRIWQFVPMILSAIAIPISFFIALVKK